MGCKRARFQKNELPLSNFPYCLISFLSSSLVDIMLNEKTNGSTRTSCVEQPEVQLCKLYFSLFSPNSLKMLL